MPNEKKGITVKVDAELHAQVRAFIEEHGITMNDFVAQALDNELHPKVQEARNMGNMRTMAFQVPEELFDQIKDYLNRHHMTQKEFVLGLIKAELDRDQQQTAVEEVYETEDEELDEEYEVEGTEGYQDNEDEDLEEYDDLSMDMG